MVNYKVSTNIKTAKTKKKREQQTKVENMAAKNKSNYKHTVKRKLRTGYAQLK
jgi:hypothetical protein